MAQKNKDLELVSTLADILRENGLAELEFRRRAKDQNDLKIRISARGSAASAPAPAAPWHSSGQPPAPDAQAAAEPPPVRPEHHPGVVTAPMVGTVFLQPEPGAPPFVEIGQQVGDGETLVIIEAMKTMNHIPAPHAGTVRSVLVENSTIVEYGSPLVIIE